MTYYYPLLSLFIDVSSIELKLKLNKELSNISKIEWWNKLYTSAKNSYKTIDNINDNLIKFISFINIFQRCLDHIIILLQILLTFGRWGVWLSFSSFFFYFSCFYFIKNKKKKTPNKKKFRKIKKKNKTPKNKLPCWLPHKIYCFTLN